MKNMFSSTCTLCIYTSMLFSSILHANTIDVLVDGQPVIIPVFGAPVGIEPTFVSEKESRESFGLKTAGCYISYGILPGHQIYIAPGQTRKIIVSGDKDIIIRCNVAQGISISRE